MLASSSPYRRMLLERLTHDFATVAPDIDETPHIQEKPESMACRLACEKAAIISIDNPEAVIIGSDQVAALGATVLGKPGNHATATSQLEQCSGKTVIFYTAVCIRAEAANFNEIYVDLTTVHFRELTPATINAYLKKDQPWDCAGSFRSEGLGTVLFASVENQDPTALIGLPLIWVADALQRAGIKLLDH
ncbi:MAG: septum formation protein Maf [Gammaproteobacteria bacterium]|nr:septum formation protein Maf [Gammaproteobacteria bacterium]MCP4088764.1 septum formation protein Maf [Gammaproteobacteria bacterium]MCP4275937.1 septum formation protein Maf [Gammaproteobacteria bacterium]MCP4832153.1 septum formation protein Maf [Gammaproteobacteria bacterium]MCP4928246.1 septum formation protein Maf [Gammaproteobacteria bacterium]